MFADLVGFTAWCSVREPSQVFVLLETLYAAFDQIAKRRRVFKVETVGDCYVAASGLPEQRRDHAVNMARFAQSCLQKTTELMQRLEVQLGPDTGDLTIRIGLHSGPVTAGVLRGDRARFQLFGDTMNIAARMESTGAPGSIHLSEETANMLIESNKKHWVHMRHEKVDVKGKGYMQTYWLSTKLGGAAPSRKEGSTCGSDLSSSGNAVDDALADEIVGKRDRLVDWHVDVFSKLLRQIVVRRNAMEKARENQQAPITKVDAQLASVDPFMTKGRTCFNELKEIIMLPTFDKSIAPHEQDIDTVELDPVAMSQLRDYIRTISHMYNDNAFHNFEHASHVTMSVSKLLSRIVMPADLIYESEEVDETFVRGEIASALHDNTYGITSDPLTQFAVVFSALIHDVDHSGIPNVQLAKENPELAAVFKNKSVAEQNSIVLAWDLLMDPSYKNLRAVICASDEEQTRFRQLVVQTVLATDIADKELKTLRNARWEDAFSENRKMEDPRITVNRKATIVIEHLIQASDVAHTMQHWHIYRKWNENFFQECYKAFLEGRTDKDPSLYWYEGEIGFFDYYVIPLARKLQECGVFGVASDEYLNYAIRNRKEWQERGEEVLAEMLQTIRNSKGNAPIRQCFFSPDSIHSQDAS